MQGVKWDRYVEDGKWTFVLSRNMLNNSAFKHVDNDVDLPRTLDYVSQEIENKFRAERYRSLPSGWKVSGGVNAEYAKYNNSTRNTVFVPEVGSVDVTFGSDFKMAKYGAFAQASRPSRQSTHLVGGDSDGRCAVARCDGGVDVAESSPWPIPSTNSVRVCRRAGRLPPDGRGTPMPASTISCLPTPFWDHAGLGADSTSTLLNWSEGLTYTTNRQLVMGIRKEIASRNAAVSVEGFYKGYTGSLQALAHRALHWPIWADFGWSATRPYLRRRGPCTWDGGAPPTTFIQGITVFWHTPWCAVNTKTQAKTSPPVPSPSSWDNRHIVSFTGGKKWDSEEVGARVLFSGGLLPHALRLGPKPAD